MKKLAIIGASYLQLPLVRKAKEMGIETHCFAWDEGAVCKEIADYFYPISITNKDVILEICRNINIQGITSIASDTAVPTICYVAEKLGLISNSYKDSLVSTDKYLMRQRFSEFNVLSPGYVIATDHFTVENLQFPLIVKPTDRSGSRGVKKIESFADLDDAIYRAQKESFSNQAIIEEYISGSEVSVETISWQGQHYILAITDKVTTGEPFFVELEHHQPSQLCKEVQDKILEETIKALTALSINFGASHSEFKITTNGDVYAIEVGARMGGDFIGSHLIELSTGYDYLKGIINVALNHFDEPFLDENKYSGVYFLSKDTEYLKLYIENYTSYSEIITAEITNNELSKIQCSADRSGYMIYQSDNRFKILNN